MASFPAPHPGPGTQEVLSEHGTAGDRWVPRLPVPRPSFCRPGNSSPPSSGTRSYTPSARGSACRGHTWPHCVPDTSCLPQGSGSRSLRLGLPIPWAILVSVGHGPWPTLRGWGAQLQEVPMPLPSLHPLTCFLLLYPHDASLLWTPLGRRDVFPLPHLPQKEL